MATSRVGKWIPVFIGDSPPHWAALVSTPNGVQLRRDHPPSRLRDEWLRHWFCSFNPSPANIGEASYVYVALDIRYWETEPDGQKRSGGVLGIGSGAYLDEPPGAVLSTFELIVERYCQVAVSGLESTEEPS